MKSVSRRFVAWIGPKLLKAAQRAFRRKTPDKVERTGERLASLWWTLSKSRREIAMSNLKMAFPDWPQSKIEETARGVFTHFGRVTGDFLAGADRTLSELKETTEVIGWERLLKSVEEGRGTMLVTGHFGNWERISALISLEGYKVTVVARDADQQEVNDVVNDLRRGPGTQVVARGDAARPLLARLRANEIVGILPDQSAKEIFIPFFGKTAGTVLGPGVISERTNSPVIPVSCVRVGVGRYRIRFDEPLVPVEGCEKRGEGMMRSIHTWLEGVIREHPEQWLWIHDRWRSARKRGLLNQ